MNPKEEVLRLLKRYKKDYRHYFKKCLKIRDKNSQVIKFEPNQTQEKLIQVVEDWKKKWTDPLTRPTLYIIILKARQEGVSTATEGVFFHDLQFTPNMVGMVVSFDEDSAVNINDMAARFYQHLPRVVKPATRPYRSKGILFENPKFNPAKEEGAANDPGLQSKFLIETARNVYAGSSYTIMRLHISELAKWLNPEETMTSLMQAVPDYGAIVVVESTANGLNYFHELWQKAVAGENNFIPLFFPWFEHNEYRLDFASDREKARFTDNLNGFTRDDGVNYRELMTTYDLTIEQIAWYRQTLRDKCSGDVNKLRQEYPSCPEEAFISSGSPVFDNQKVLNRKKLLERLYKENPPEVGNIESRSTPDGDPVKGTEKFIPSTNGYLTVYTPPEPGVPYVVGGDIAEGGLDWSVGQVIDNVTGEQVATWRGHVDTDVFAKEMFKLGHYYNEALISIETNFDTHPVKELQRLRYRRQFRREEIDRITNRKQEKSGFKTTSTTRPHIIGELVQIVREETELINDLTTLDEMLTFVRNETGKPEAQQGRHDDTVLALAIAHNARSQQKSSPEKPKQSNFVPGGTYHPSELKMLGFSDSKIRHMAKRGEIKLIGGIPERKKKTW